MEEKEIGAVTHYFGHLSVGIIKLKDSLKVGDTIRFKGHTTDFEQVVESMQIEHKDVQEAKANDAVGLKVKDHVREHDVVFKVIK